MTITIHQPHDKFFKANLKYQSVAIDFLKTYLEQETFFDQFQRRNNPSYSALLIRSALKNWGLMF